jgi:putative ABC transport system permease protein
VPIFQEYNGRMNIVVRMAPDPHAGIAIIQSVVAEADRNVIVYSGRTGNEHVADSLWQQRMASMWIGAFSLVALLLAAIGLYGVIAQSVAQRTREVGIRIALGASARTAAAMVVRQGMLLACAGLAIGVPTAIGFARLMRRYLEGVDGPDPAIYAAVAFLLGTVMLIACWGPARRAARIDPVQALRCD